MLFWLAAVMMVDTQCAGCCRSLATAAASLVHVRTSVRVGDVHALGREAAHMASCWVLAAAVHGRVPASGGAVQALDARLSAVAGRGCWLTRAAPCRAACCHPCRQQRPCYLYAFSGPGEVQELELSVDLNSLDQLLDFLSCSFMGGLAAGR
jgi:hypothetical protein